MDNFSIESKSDINSSYVNLETTSEIDDNNNSQMTTISDKSKLKSKSTIEPYESLKNRVTEAGKNKKIFTLYDGFPELRESLIKRGWIEKCAPNYLQNIHILPDETIMALRRRGNIYETTALSKIAKCYNPNFIWDCRPNTNNIKRNDRYKPYRNTIQRSDYLNFTTKFGLINCINNAHWHTDEGKSEIKAPRHHDISDKNNHLDFLRDYRSTYCCSLLKYIIDENPIDIFSFIGDMTLDTISFAIQRIRTEISLKSDSIDVNITNNKNPFNDQFHNNDTEWTKLYSNVNLLVKKSIKIKIINKNDVNDIRNTCIELIDKCKKIWPLLISEGYNNLWILKPGSSCRGRGICIRNKFDDIINFTIRRPLQQYIVQKYIELPLLIYKTKFDIRQHILLTVINDRFNIWMYQDCYLRFCSNEYDLNNLSESIHITNRAIQEKYKNGDRNIKIPPYNMWSLDQFQQYLKSIKKYNLWNTKIYAGMKKNIIGVIMASLEETEFIENTFQLYGCDFMLDENFEPILIEINSLPSMIHSTCVTAKLCPAVLRDLIKVVIDWSNNKKSDTGKFELISSLDFQTELYYIEYNKEFDIIGKSVTNGKLNKRKLIQEPIINENQPLYLRNYRKPIQKSKIKLHV